MTKFWLILLRIICVIQTLIAVFICFSSLLGLFNGGGLILLLSVVSFGFIAALPILAFTIFNNNYPDKPLEARQKKYFNRIFIINFLLIAFLFGIIFSDFRQASDLSNSEEFDSAPQLFLFIPFIVSCCILIFHFSILYGLYWMRRQINNNARSEQFDFEMQKEDNV